MGLSLWLSGCKVLVLAIYRCGLTASDFCYWHETDMPKYLGDVRCWVNSGKHVLALSFSGFDPKAK